MATLHLLRGAGSYSGTLRSSKATMPFVNRPPWLPTACGRTRPTHEVTDTETAVTCGGCKRVDEYGNNWRQRTDRERARQRAAAIRTAARNTAIGQLMARHPEEFADLYEAEHALLALATPARSFPEDPGIPAPPRPTATTPPWTA